MRDRKIQDLSRYQELTYDGFRRLAKNPALSRYEKIGFPDAYRSGREEAIFDDIRHKLRNLEGTGKLVIDIGSGCSDLPRMLIDVCREHAHAVVLIDSRP